MSAVMPDRPLPDDGLTKVEEQIIEQQVIDKARELIGESDFWDQALEGQNSITAELPSTLARMASAAMSMNSPNTSPAAADILAWGIANEFARFVRNIAYKRAKAEAQALADAGELA